MIPVTNSADDPSIDSVLDLGTGGVCGEEDDILTREGAVCADGIAVDGELVGRERTSLDGAKNGDGSKFLDSRDTDDHGLVLCELLGTDGERDGLDSGHGNGDTTDQED